MDTNKLKLLFKRVFKGQAVINGLYLLYHSNGCTKLFNDSRIGTNSNSLLETTRIVWFSESIAVYIATISSTVKI